MRRVFNPYAAVCPSLIMCFLPAKQQFCRRNARYRAQQRAGVGAYARDARTRPRPRRPSGSCSLGSPPPPAAREAGRHPLPRLPSGRLARVPKTLVDRLFGTDRVGTYHDRYTFPPGSPVTQEGQFHAVLRVYDLTQELPVTLKVYDLSEVHGDATCSATSSVTTRRSHTPASARCASTSRRRRRRTPKTFRQTGCSTSSTRLPCAARGGL
jgi:hypothetical protein